MEYRGTGGQKRARGDAAHGEGDWTCAKCGNVNFSFRTTCNLRKCGASKPAHAAPPRTGPAYPRSYEPLYMGGGTSAPSSNLASNYGTPLGMSSATGLPYDYSSSMNIPPSYNTIPLQSSYTPPSSFVSGGMGYGTGSALGYGPGSGLGCVTGSVMDGAYGMNMGMARTPVTVFQHKQMAGAETGLYMEENGSRKRRGDAKSDGDWTCPKCGNTNYSFRIVCNMKKCNTPKPSAPDPQTHGKLPSADLAAPDGSWTCIQCGNVNYPFRTKCNRRSCGAEKPPITKNSSESPSSSEE